MRTFSNRLPRYGIAVLTTAGASLLALLLSPLSLRVPFALFAAAAIVSSLQGGLKPGLLATTLSTAALAVQYWLLPLAQLPESEGEVLPLLIVFVIVGLLSSYLGKQCWQAVHAVEWIQATLASFGDGLIFTDAERRITFMNPVACALTGWKQKEAAERALERIRPSAGEQARHPVKRAVIRALSGGLHSVVAEPALLFSPSGAAQAVDMQAAAIRDGEGSLLGAMLLLRGGAASPQAEPDLRQKEEQYRSLAACAPVGILQMDPECRCVYTNCSCQLTGGFSAEEGLGEGWAAFLHPEDRARVVPAWTAAMRAGKQFTCELRFQTSAQNGRWICLRSSPMYSDVGKLIGHVGVLHDLADKKLTEEALRETALLLSAVAEESADAIFVKNLEGRYLLTNAAGARLVGKTVQEIIGKEESELFARDAAGCMREHDRQVLASGQAQTWEQGEPAPGCLRQYVFRKTPFRDGEGNVVGLISVGRERTEEKLQSETAARHRAEERLREAEARLQALADRAAELEKAKISLEKELHGRRQTAEMLAQEKDFLESRADGILRNGKSEVPRAPHSPRRSLSAKIVGGPAVVHEGTNGRPAAAAEVKPLPVESPATAKEKNALRPQNMDASTPPAEARPQRDEALDWLSFD